MHDAAITKPLTGISSRELESNVRYYSRMFPTRLRSAEGATITDVHGRRYIDFFAGAGALNYGHNHPAMTASVVEYLASNGIIHSLDMDTEARAAWLEDFQRAILRSGGRDYRVQFTGPTGTNCVEAALKLARKVTGRSNVVAFTCAFHGVSLASLAVTAAAEKRHAFGHGLHHVLRMPFDGYLGGGDAEIEWMERMLLGKGCGAEAPAAFIFECVQGEGGLNVARARWAQQVCKLAKQLGALVILDEVQTGCGRTGTFFGFEALGISPDLVCVSKSLSGLGIPMAVLLLRPEIDVWAPGEHNGTFRGNNLAFVSGLQALKLWRTPAFTSLVSTNMDAVAQRLGVMARKYGEDVCTVRGRGLLIGLHFRYAHLAHAVRDEAFARGLLLENCGPDNEVCKTAPPLNIDPKLRDEGLDILDAAIQQVLPSARIEGAAVDCA